MSTLKTTLKVESANLFPNSIAVNSVTNTTDISDSNLGKITVNHLTPSYLVTGDVGAKGTFLYIKSASTNRSDTVINVYGEDSETPIATVYSGDNGFIQVTGTQGKLYAKTTYGTASLEYFTGSRGENLGQFTLVYYLEDTPGDTWQYFVIDANSGVPSKLYDTGFAKADYDMDTYETGVQNGGIVFRLNATGLLDDVLFLTDKTGAPLLGHGLTVDYDDWWSLEGKGVFWTYETMTGWRLSYYNGNEVYHHDFIGATDIGLESSWDNCSANGTIAAYITTHNGIVGQEAIYLIKDDQKTLITDINTGTDIFADAKTYTFANYFVVTLFDDDNGYYTGIKIFDTSGSLLKSVDLPTDTYTNLNYDFYGTGHWQTYLYNSADTAVDYLMFNYNQSTGTLIGEDLDWTHVKGANYPSVIVPQDYNYSPTGTASAKYESTALCFYLEDDFNGDLITPVNVDYLDIHYVIGNATTANKRVFHNDAATDCWVNLTVRSNDTSIHMLSSGANDLNGPLNVVNFTTAGSTTIALVSDLTTYTPGDTWNFYSTGDYRLFQYSIAATDKTIYKVLSNTAVLATLTIDNAYEDDNFATSFNSIFILTNGLVGTQKCWYFNTNTKAFVQLPQVYGMPYLANITATNGLEDGYIQLISPSEVRTDNKWGARMLVNGIISNEVILVDETLVNINQINWYHTPQGFWFLYTDVDNSEKWVVKGWDRSLTKTYDIVTDYQDLEWDSNYHNINMIAFKPTSVSNEYNIFNFGSVVNYRQYTGGYTPNYVINDWNYIWD
jgi:hypothetical protein